MKKNSGVAVAKGNAVKTLSSRIEWCDIFKGIMITWVVYSHSTHEFNRFSDQFGYQFVIAGLFFISGYTAKVKNEPIFATIAKKFYKLMFPYYTIHIVMLFVFWILQRAGVLSLISTTQYTVSYWEALKKLFEGNNYIYCDWLGAMWFVPVLFLAECIFTILTRVCKKDWIFCVVSLLLFLGSDDLAARLALSDTYYYSIDLAGMAHGFLMLGYMMKKHMKREVTVRQLWVRTAIIGIVWWSCVRLGFQYTFDWPSRDVNGAVDFLLPLFGIAMMMDISRLMVRNRPLKRLFMYLGQNSMGIMCFHLMGFKVAYLILILLGLMEKSEAYRLIPGAEMAIGWPVIFPMGMLVGIFAWKGLMRFRISRLLLGGENPSELYAKWMGTKAAAGIRKFVQGRRHWKVKLLALCVCIVCVFTGVRLYRCSGTLEIKFPYQPNLVTFSGGWLPQSEAEDYRWFEKQAELQTILVDQNRLKITGYLLDSADGATYIAVKMNGEELYREAAAGGQMIDIELDIEKYRRAFRKNTLEIETDGVRVPDVDDVDQRSFSAFINTILFY